MGLDEGTPVAIVSSQGRAPMPGRIISANRDPLAPLYTVSTPTKSNELLERSEFEILDSAGAIEHGWAVVEVPEIKTEGQVVICEGRGEHSPVLIHVREVTARREPVAICPRCWRLLVYRRR